ncbi:MAG: hypothetical protein HY904_05640 [Deltaproteobacteria bacterium]|nr:hypothetical protein [Deltaproteobacteria bacterium]
MRALVLILVGACSVLRSGAPPEVNVLNADRTQQLRLRARQVQWAFPSSSGRPVPADPPAWAAEFAADRESFARAATYLADHGQPEAALELAARVWRLWVLARDDAAGRRFLAPLLDRPGLPPCRDLALALYGDGLFAFRLGDLAASRARNAAALRTARTSGDREAEGLALLGLSRVAFSDGNHAAAREHAQDALALLTPLDPALTQAPLHMLAQATRALGTVDDAAVLFARSLDLNRRLGDHGMVQVELHNLGHVELRRGNVDAAERLFAEGAADVDTTDRYGAAMVRFNQAAVAGARQDPVRAAALLREARAILADARLALAADDAVEFDRLEAALSAAPAAR